MPRTNGPMSPPDEVFPEVPRDDREVRTDNFDRGAFGGDDEESRRDEEERFAETGEFDRDVDETI